MNDDYVDVNYTYIPNDKSNKNYYTINEIAVDLQVEETDILFWINKLNDILKINSTGMFQLFTKTDFENIKEIKQLIVNENKSIADVKEYFSQDKNLVVIKEKSQHEIELINVFNTIFQLQNKEIVEIKNTNKQILEYNQKIIKVLAQLVNQGSLNDIGNLTKKIDTLKDIQVDNQKEILEIKENQEQFKESILKELQETKKEYEMTLKMKNSMEEKRKENEEKEKHNFIYKLFHK